MSIHKPLFSIGVTTYNRKDLLKQTLLSLLDQTFTDFEVIVGNDYIKEILSADVMGINDPRIKFVNHSQNLGELKNMNSLLNMANGKYFSWQFDDDPCAPEFLQEVHSALIKFNFPVCVFTSYSLIYGTSVHKFKKNYDLRAKLFSGKDFLKAYLSGRLKALGCCGFYDTDYLKKIGGVQPLTDGPTALHTEYALLIRAYLLPEVAYINAPLVTSRVHENSWTSSSIDVESFKQAGINLIRSSIEVFLKASPKNDFETNLSSILKFVLSSVVVRSIMRSKKLNIQEIKEYVSFIEKEFEP
ncbi:MAG: glycosyltransferase, partial [bacterium]